MIHRHVCDLVHEERALIRQFEPSGPVRLGIGKGPLTWPNKWPPKIPSDNPPMLTVIMLCDARCESAWSARATRPLPVPFSPVINTFASEGATREINSSTGRIRGDSAMIFGALPRSN